MDEIPMDEIQHLAVWAYKADGSSATRFWRLRNLAPEFAAGTL